MVAVNLFVAATKKQKILVRRCDFSNPGISQESFQFFTRESRRAQSTTRFEKPALNQVVHTVGVNAE